MKTAFYIFVAAGFIFYGLSLAVPDLSEEAKFLTVIAYLAWSMTSIILAHAFLDIHEKVEEIRFSLSEIDQKTEEQKKRDKV